MLSICIPVYNYDVTMLVQILYQQAGELQIVFEIICIDDCSKEEYRKVNEQVITYAKYVQLHQNIGRAKIRNLFLEYVHFKYLLFLDCDSEIISDDFVKR